MRLRRLDLTRYGRFTDHALDFGDPAPGQPDLHIVHGPNEAGKSTLLNAWLDLLFGIGARSTYAFLHPYDTLRIGATLDLPDGQRDLVRVKKTRDSLTDPAGRPVAEGVLRPALGGLDRAAWADMFALDAGTMEAGGDSILSSKGDLGETLFSASAGLSDLGRRLEGLRAAGDDFYRKRAQKTGLKLMRAELDALTADRKAIELQAPEYARRRMAAETARADRDARAAEHAAAEAACAAAQAALDTLPLMADWAAIRDELAPLDALPDAPADWPDRVAALLAEDVALRTRTSGTAAETTRLAKALADLVPDDAALARADAAAFDEELRARFLSARDDLPRRRDELAALDRRMTDLAARIGGTDPKALRIEPATLDALDRLAAGHGALAARLATATEETRARAEDLAAAGGPLEDAEQDRAAQTLRAALDPLHRADLAGRAAAAAAEAAEAAARRDAALARLAPWAGDATALRALDAPSDQTLAGWRAALDAAVAARDAAARAAADRQADLRRSIAERDALAETLGPADPETETAARADRDAAWTAHRAALDAASADDFAAALAAHDRARDAQLARAADIGLLHKARHDAATHARLAADADGALTAADLALVDRRAELAARAGAILPGRDPVDPLADLEGWLARRLRALDLADQADAAARAADRAANDAQQAAAALRAALAAAGAPDDGSLGDLAARAQSLLDEAEAETARRSERARLTRDHRARVTAENAARRALDDWHAALARTAAGTFLSDPPPDADRLRAVLPLLRDLNAALEQAGDLRHRIERMERDQGRFAAAVADTADALGLAAGDPLARHAAAADRLAQARRTADRRAALATDLDRAETDARELAARRLALDAEARRITDHLGVVDLPGAQTALARIARRADLRDASRRLAAQITGALGVADVATAHARLSATPPEALHAALARATADRDETVARLEAARQALFQADHAFGSVSGDDRVAQIDARRRALLMQIEDEARGWLRQRAGVIATDHALRSYRDHHRSGMMARASDAFAAMTGGAYAGLAAQPGEGGRDRLIAIPQGGGSRPPEALSKGTRFQLYLALRIAGFHEWVAAHGPVPVIADDVMETFDDDRTRLALGALAEVARSTQVIYLTHHAHVCDLARAACPGVRVTTL